jgi:preprotein translocase subunit SecA
MVHLRQGIHLRAYAQKNPKQEYKRESFALFEQLLQNLKYEVIKFLSHVHIQHQDESALIEARRREAAEREKLAFQHAAASAMAEEALASGAAEPAPAETPQTFTREQPKVGRNEPCPCGSGRKYKQCHGRID